MGRGKDRRFCDHRCQTKAWKKANAERHAQGLAAIQQRQTEALAATKPVCKYCPDRIPPGQKFLCGKPDCRRKHRNEAQRAARAAYKAQHGKSYDPQSKRAARALRRARKASPEDAERFDPQEIYERDGWICGICHQPVDSKLVYPDPMSASLDHIQPLALDGKHRRDNVQCSHLICNLSKGARVDLEIQPLR